MTFKVFDVSMGSCHLLISPTGRRELVDFGCSTDWSPVSHVLRNLLGRDGELHRIVLTHHHGDHLNDLPSLGSKRPGLILRRRFEGKYRDAARKSNSPEGQRLAERFAEIFDDWTGEPDEDKVNEAAWGMSFEHAQLSVDEAEEVSDSDNSLVNNCSFVRVYASRAIKIVLAGDMEKEGMSRLLERSRTMRTAVSGANVLVAPHHAHRSGFCIELFEAMGKPDVVLSSLMSGDENVDSRYSDADFVTGINDGSGGRVRLMTTRKYGATTVRAEESGAFSVCHHSR